MAKRPPPGICIYCLEEKERTWDHVFPESWYPEATPPNIEKWKVPVCCECNRELGEIENDLLIKFGVCLDPEERHSYGITQKVLRALDPSKGKGKRDKGARAKDRQRFLEGVVNLDELPAEGLFPNLGPLPTVQYDEYHAVGISKASLEKLVEKIVRGLTYKFDKQVIGSNLEIGAYFAEDEDVKEIEENVRYLGKTFHRGPGIEVTRAVRREGSIESLYIIEIWGRLKMYASVLLKSSKVS